MRRLMLTLLVLLMPVGVWGQTAVAFDYPTDVLAGVAWFDLVVDTTPTNIGIPSQAPDAFTPAGHSTFRTALPSLSGTHTIAISACASVCVTSAPMTLACVDGSCTIPPPPPSGGTLVAPSGLRLVTAGPTVSPENTTIPPATQIIDSTGAVWTRDPNGEVDRNGVWTNILAIVVKWKTVGGALTLIAQTIEGNWRIWNGSGWVDVGPVEPV